MAPRGIPSDEPRAQPRRSSLQSIQESLSKRTHSHFMSTLALCSSVFCMFFVLFSVFPYSGFMAMALVPGLTEETAGPYAGMIACSFMVGRAVSSYPLGKVADRYGRRVVLIVSLVNRAVFSLAFGMATSLSMALWCRFLMGLGDGTMLMARTAITELARGDKELEKKGMGMVMSMVGYGTLVSPVVGGMLSQPLQQYPDSMFFHSWEAFLTKYPFFIPNLIGTLVTLVSLFFVLISVEETLPKEQLRDWKQDILQGIEGLFSRCSKGETRKKSHYENIPDAEVPKKVNVEDEEIDLLEHLDCDQLSVLMATPTARESYSSALHRSSIKRQEGESLFESADEGEATVKSIMSKKETRDHLISFWVNAFFNIAVNETFPLFAMSRTGGLGWTASRIGAVGTASGLVYCVSQYFIFSRIMNGHSVHEGIRITSFWGSIPVCLFPIALILQHQSMVGDQMCFVFLALLYSVFSIFHSVFCACIAIASNRTVEASHRATMNGLSNVGVSVGRGAAPLFAGALVGISMSGLLPEVFRSVLLYGVLTVAGFGAYSTTLCLNEEGDVL